MDELFAEPVDWLGTLPPFQRALFAELTTSGMQLDAILRDWFTTSGPADTFPYGGEGFGAVFYDKFLAEIRDLLCGGAKYQEDRKNLVRQAGAGKAMAVGAITTILVPHLGAAAALVGPGVALVLQIIGQMGLRAWCEAQASVAEAG